MFELDVLVERPLRAIALLAALVPAGVVSGYLPCCSPAPLLLVVIPLGLSLLFAISVRGLPDLLDLIVELFVILSQSLHLHGI